MFRRSYRSLARVILTLALFGSSAASACTGDCNSDGRVGVDEIVVGVGIALGESAWARCVRMDADRDGAVGVDDLLRGVQRALEGCVDCAALGACPDDFDFDSQREVRIDLTLDLGGEPVAGAVVTLEHLGEAYGDSVVDAPAEIFRGATDGEGRLRACVRMAAWIETLDLVVQKSGLRGPYTDELERIAAGPFAPSARVSLPVEALADLDLELERK